jgi:hypothetical protein
VAAGVTIDRGFNWLVYSRIFLRTMKPRALAKWQQHPKLFDRERLLAARTLRDFDDCFTAPLHGFAEVDDHWRRASAKPHLKAVRVPVLVLNAKRSARAERLAAQPTRKRSFCHAVATGRRRPRWLSRRSLARPRARDA